MFYFIYFIHLINLKYLTSLLIELYCDILAVNLKVVVVVDDDDVVVVVVVYITVWKICLK